MRTVRRGGVQMKMIRTMQEQREGYSKNEKDRETSHRVAQECGVDGGPRG